MPKNETFIFVIGWLIISIILEITRQQANIPITIIDLSVLFFCLFVIVSIFRSPSYSKKTKKKQYDNEPVPFFKKMGLVLTFILMIVLGVSVFWIGIQEPFKFFTGIKGAAHGYTLVALGLIIIGTSVFGLWKVCLIPTTGRKK